MFVSFFIIIISLDFFFFTDTALQSCLMYGVSLSSHCALIRGDLVSIDEYCICRHFHPLTHLHNIAYQYIVLVHLVQLSISHHRHPLAFISYTVKLRKLPRFRIIVYCSH